MTPFEENQHFPETFVRCLDFLIAVNGDVRVSEEVEQESLAAVMKGDADYGATGSRDDDLRVRARVEGAHGNNDGDSNPTEPPRSRRSAFAVDRNGALLTVDTASSSTQSFVHPFDPNKPYVSDLDTDDVSEGDVPFFLESPKMAKFDNWVPDEESEDETSEEESEEESEGSKPASSSIR